MRTREEAVGFSEIQMGNDSAVYDEIGHKPSGAWHYGKMDIQELLDYIYGVNSKGEEVGKEEIKEQAKQGSEA